jgi:GTP pyrophosphokinase
MSALPAVDPGAMQGLQASLGSNVAVRVEGFARMGQIQALRVRDRDSKKASERSAQLEAARKMLLAMVQDVRVVLIKLADQMQTLRFLAGRGDDPARQSAARDTFELFAPLANRLGVWQLKWELEDLAFRCSDPEAYKRIARELDEKRADREAYIGFRRAGAARRAGKAGLEVKSADARSTSTAYTRSSAARTAGSPSCSTSARCASWSTT